MSYPRYPKYKPSGVEWLGDVPEHWRVLQFRRCVRIAEGQVDPEAPEFASLQLIAPNHIESGTGRLLGFESATEQGAESGKYLCLPGDVVYSKIRPALRKVCQARQRCLCSADMYPLRVIDGLESVFLLWWLLSEQFSSLAIMESQRVAMPKINRDSLSEIPVVVPPTEEQRQIAEMLADETETIDELIALQERLIGLLKEKRQAVISHAVTKGLNPDAPMKPSGVEWLGDVPGHWSVTPLGRVASCKGGAGFPDAMQGRLDQPVAFFKVADLARAGADGALADASHTISEGEAAELRARIFPIGTIVFAKVGAALLLQRYRWLSRPSCIDNNMMGMAVGSESSTRFMLYLLPLLDLSLIANPGAVPSLNEGQISGQRVALPPLCEQKRIAEHLDDATSKIDTLIAEAERAIALLQERRTALISAAVTGQIDVRNAAENAVA